MNAAGDLYGAWNQHYPATFAAYGGDLNGEPLEIGEGDIGGYPAVAFDAGNNFWVFWESFLWERAYGDQPQRLQAARLDAGPGRFSTPYTLSDPSQTVYNQTPCVAVGPADTLFVAWSGRADFGKPWGIYLVKRLQDDWSQPERVSLPDEHPRAPAIAGIGNGPLWLTWHGGAGDRMRIRLLCYESRTNR